MFAIVESGGKQYRVAEGDVLRVEKLAAESGTEVDLPVLLLGGDAVVVGTPHVDGARVVAEVIEHGRGPKLDIYKFKAKNNYRRHTGHRQQYTDVRVTRIEGAGGGGEGVSKKATPRSSGVGAGTAAEAASKDVASKDAAAKEATVKEEAAPAKAAAASEKPAAGKAKASGKGASKTKGSSAKASGSKASRGEASPKKASSTRAAAKKSGSRRAPGAKKTAGKGASSRKADAEASPKKSAGRGAGSKSSSAKKSKE